MNHSFRLLLLALLFCLATARPAAAQRQMERLGRGLIAQRISSTQVYVGWRLLGNDPEDVAFNLYRSADGAAAVKLNASPITASTNYLDTPGSLATTAYTYSVQPVLDNVEVTDTWANPLSGPATVAANTTALTWPYLRIPLQNTPDGALEVKFCWVGDLDGDGEYDFVVDRQPPTDARQFLEAYKRDGTLLWRMNMGPNSVDHYNIEPGSSTISVGHGDNVTVFDMDGDGKAEVLVRTADGVVFANGATVTNADDRVQFMSVVNGLTGVELARAQIPNPFISDGQMNGHMGILYCDGIRPSVFWQSTNRRADLHFNAMATTWDYRNGVITQRWSRLFNTLSHEAAGHQIRFGDADNDGKDEYLDVGHGLDDDGTELYGIQEIVHGDRYHIGDIDPDRPGLETFVIQQNNASGLATALYESGTGKIIKKWYAGGVVDVGRGSATDFDAAHKGSELVSTQEGIFDAKGNQIYTYNFFPAEAIWWDADLSREYLQSNSTVRISKITNGSLGYTDLIDKNTPAPGGFLADGGRPAFWGDLFGDWREELLVAETGNAAIRIYTTPRVTGNRLYTLMHNPQYRDQTTTKGYVQASIVDYYLGTGMTPPPPPPMVDAKLVWRGGSGATTWDNGATPSWLKNGVNSAFAAGDTVRFDLSSNATTNVALTGTLTPGAVTVYSPKDQTFSGSGTITGSTKFVKAGAGELTLTGTHSFTGATTVWDGGLYVNGDLTQSPITVWGGTWGGALAKGLTGGRIGGTGRFSQPVALKYRGAITPGAGMGSAGTVTLGAGLTAEDGSTFALDLSNSPGGTNDRIAIIGNLALSGTVTIVINPLSGTLGAGTYTLATYTGALTGGLANFAVAVPAGTPYTLAAGGGAITLTVPVTRAAAAVTWRGTGGTWDIAASQNWLRAGSPDVFVAGDTVTFDGTGAANPAITLNTGAPVAGLIVNGTPDYTLSGTGSIAGSGGLTKTGTGTFTLGTTNDYTGPTTISGGVLVADNLNNGGLPSSLGAASTAASNLVLNGGTLRIPADQTSTNRSLTLGASGGALDVASASSSLQISGVVTGAGTLTKSGPGTLILASANTFSGNTVINGGTIYLAGEVPNVSGLGTGGTVTINNGTLTMSDVQASETAAWNLVVPTGATARLNVDGRSTLTGSLTGGGNFTVGTEFIRTDFKGNWSAFTGQLTIAADADGGDFRITNTFGFGGASLNLGSEVFAYYNAGSSVTIPLGALSGNGSATLAGGSSSGGTTTFQVGARNTNSTFAGVIANRTGPTALTKIGTGTLTLSGVNTYTGATTVSAGTLLVSGSLGNTAITIANGATLAGNGAIGGSVTFNGTHRPGSATAIAGGVTYAATAHLATEFFDNATTAGTFDKVTAGALTITAGATLDLVFNSSGSQVDFSDPFWGAAHTWTVVSGTSRTGTFTLGTISNDLGGRAASDYGAFALMHSGNNVTVAWTPRLTQTITFGALADQAYDSAPFAVNATASSGLPVAFSIVSGPATISGNTVTITGVGTVTVRASQAGDAVTFPASDVDRAFAVTPAAQTISFGLIAGKTYGNAPFSVNASASSGLAVLFSIVSGPATISGNTVTITGAGTVTVRAAQAGNANYLPAASVDQSFAVAKAAATVALGGLADTYTGAPQTATATTNPAGLTVTFTYNGSATAPTNAGSYTVVGTISDANYQGSASGTLVIAKATATVTLGGLADTYTGTPQTATATTAPAGLTVTFTYNGSATAPTNAGSYSVVGTISDANYQGSASGTLVIAKATATVTLGGLADTYTGTPQTATATTAPAGLTVTFTYNGSATAPTNVGSYNVVGTISDANYQGTATGTLVIAKGTATVTLGGLAATYDGTPKAVTVTTNPAGLANAVTYNASATVPSAVGSYAVVATVTDANYQGSATGTLVISTTGNTWTNATTGTALTWSTAGNWSGGVPASGAATSLRFLTGQTLAAGTITSTHNLATPFTLNSLTLEGTGPATGASTVAIGGSALTLAANGAVNPVINLAAAPGAGGLTYTVATPLAANVPVTFQGNGAAGFVFNGVLSGSGSLTKAGTATLTLGGVNTFTGGTFINAGTVALNSDAANTSAFGTGAVTFGNGATLAMYDNTAGDNNVAWNIVVPTGVTATLNADSRTVFIGTLTGAGTLNFRTPYIRTSITGDWSAFAGTLNVTTDADGGAFRFGTNYSYAAFPNATLALPASVIAQYIGTVNTGTGTTLAIGALSGPAGATLQGGTTVARTVTYRVGGKNTSATFAGATSEQAAGTLTAFTKTGTGTWTLSGTLGHAGNTTVEQGTLTLTGTATPASSPVIDVQTGASLNVSGLTGGLVIGTAQSLKSTGPITGNVTVNGTHQPGSASTLSGTLGYGAASRFKADLNASSTATGTFDKVTATGALTITGGAALDIVLNAAGSTVNLTDVFWDTAHTWTVLTGATRTGSFTLGTVSADPGGRAASTQGTFSLQQTGGNVIVAWTPAAGGGAAFAGSNGPAGSAETGDRPTGSGSSGGTSRGTPKLEVAGFNRATATMILTVQSTVGHDYHLQVSETLAPNSWVTVETQPGDDGVLTFVQDTEPVSKCFYRIVVSP